MDILEEAHFDSSMGLSLRDPVRDSLWGHIYLVDGFQPLISVGPFQKLRWIMQLGPTHLVYPGATHSRAAHSLGVYHLSLRLIRSLYYRGARELMSKEGLRSFLVAALLHDIGHFPFTHALKDLPLTDHEILSGRLVLLKPLKELIGRAGACPQIVSAIIDNSIKSENRELLLYRNLLSGVLDPDKLDYLNRDARYCGVPYGAQDIDFIFSRLSIDSQKGLTIDSKGISSVEAVLFSKYLMYKSVYWHRDVRSATAMIKHALFIALERKEISAESLYDLDDNGLFKLLESCSSDIALFAPRVRNGNLFKMIFELPFNSSIELHRRLENLDTRKLFLDEVREKIIARTGKTLGPEEIILDLPEPINFESDLSIADENSAFSSANSVFSKNTVSGFTDSLRILRIFIIEEYMDKLSQQMPDIVEILRNFLL